MQVQEIFSDYLDDYFGEMSRLGYGDLRRRQKGLFSSLAFGAAGVAYAHWHAGTVLADPGLLDAAERWSRSALLAQHGRLAFVGLGAESGMAPSAYLYGRAGLYFTHALVAQARRTRQEAIGKFIELGRLSSEGPPDLYTGTAGCLTGSAILLRHTGDPRLRELGETLASRLCSVLEREEGAREQPLDLGLAHGRTGLYLSLLLWTSAAKTDLSVQVGPGVKDLLRSALREPSRLCSRTGLHSWLCNGFPGLTLLAVKACQVLGDSWFLAAARRAARRSLAHPSPRPDLCCGRAGAAFACLALAGVDPGGPWRQKAEELALSTLLVDREAWRVAGLFGGEAAIPCLVLNLLAGITAGPPCLDLIDPPRLPPAGPAGRSARHRRRPGPPARHGSRAPRPSPGP